MGEVSTLPLLKEEMRQSLMMRGGRRLWGQSQTQAVLLSRAARQLHGISQGALLPVAHLCFFSKLWNRGSGHRNTWWLLSQVMPTLSPCAVTPRAGVLARWELSQPLRNRLCSTDPRSFLTP